MRNLDIATMRALMAVVDSGGITRAASALNLTQSAVSMQIKRLEEMLGLALFDRSNRQVRLTSSGQQLLGYARRMVRINDEVVRRLTDQTFEGEIRLGVPHDIVYPAIPQILRKFHATYPRVKVTLDSSYTNRLHEAFQKNALDLILTTETELYQGGETLTQKPLRWVGAPQGVAHKERPVRLAYCRFCRFRANDVNHLDQHGINWEIAVESDNDTTIEATVSADLAITSMIEGSIPPHLEPINSPELPKLDLQMINLYGGKAPANAATQDLITMLREGVKAI